MDITQGCVNVQLILQSVVHPPCQFHPESSEMKVEKAFFVKKKSRGRKVWDMNKFLIKLMLALSFGCINFLFANLKRDGKVAQLCFYTLVFALGNLALPSFTVLQDHAKEYCFAMTQIFKLAEFRAIGYPSRRRLPSVNETIVYLSFLVTVTAIPIMAIVMPFVLSYHPVKMCAEVLSGILGVSLPTSSYYKIFVKISSSLVYGFVATHGAGIWLFLILSIANFAETMQTISVKLFHPHNHAILMFPIYMTKYHGKRKNSDVEKHIKMFFSATSASFSECWRLHQILKILIEAGSSVASQFLQMLVLMGILAAACSGYTALRLYDKLAPSVYFCLSLIFPMFITINFVFITLASVPSDHGTKFRQWWKWKLVRKVDRMRLRACAPIGYTFGFIENCTRKTALSIADVGVNLVASLTLLRSS